SSLDLLALLDLALVLRSVVRRGFLVVARQRFERVVRNPVAQNVDVKNADQAVATADVAVEERERLARLERFDPQRDLAQFNGHRIAVDAVDAVRDDFTQCMLEFVLGRSAWASVLGDAGGGTARRTEQEMAGAARRIDDRQLQYLARRILHIPGLDGIE